EHYIEIVQRLERAVLAGIQKNLRSRIHSGLATALKMLFVANYSRAERLGELLERFIFSKAGLTSPMTLDEMTIRPVEVGSAVFVPALDNWRRAAKVPELVLNATTLNSGRSWQFTTT